MNGRAALVDPAFWRSRRVFVTGHTGFKGSWLSYWLYAMGAAVRGYSLPPPTTPSLFDTLGLRADLDHIEGNLTDLSGLRASMVDWAPEVVFHLAAQPLVRESYRSPIETLSTNVMGTAHVMEACRSCPRLRAVVCVTTDKCYENREWPWGYREIDALGGHDPYSASKAAAELVAAAYRRSFFGDGGDTAAVLTARAGNVIGGGDWSADRILPDAVRAFSSRGVLLVRRPGATRPWQHVLEPLSGYLALAQAGHGHRDRYAGAWNFGPDDQDVVAVADLLEQFGAAWGPGARWEVQPDAASEPHEAGLLKLDASKARAHLGWRPRWHLADAVTRTARWYRRFYDGAAAAELRAMISDDIAAFTA